MTAILGDHTGANGLMVCLQSGRHHNYYSCLSPDARLQELAHRNAYGETVLMVALQNLERLTTSMFDTLCYDMLAHIDLDAQDVYGRTVLMQMFERWNVLTHTESLELRVWTLFEEIAKRYKPSAGAGAGDGPHDTLLCTDHCGRNAAHYACLHLPFSCRSTDYCASPLHSVLETLTSLHRGLLWAPDTVLQRTPWMYLLTPERLTGVTEAERSSTHVDLQTHHPDWTLRNVASIAMLFQSSLMRSSSSEAVTTTIQDRHGYTPLHLCLLSLHVCSQRRLQQDKTRGIGQALMSLQADQTWCSRYSYKNPKCESLFHCMPSLDRDVYERRLARLVVSLADPSLYGPNVFTCATVQGQRPLIDAALIARSDGHFMEHVLFPLADAYPDAFAEGMDTVGACPYGIGTHVHTTPWQILCKAFLCVSSNPRNLQNGLYTLLRKVPYSRWDALAQTTTQDASPTYELVSRVTNPDCIRAYKSRVAKRVRGGGGGGSAHRRAHKNEVANERFEAVRHHVFRLLRYLFAKATHVCVNVNIKAAATGTTALQELAAAPPSDDGLLRDVYLRGGAWADLQAAAPFTFADTPAHHAYPDKWFQQDACVLCCENVATVGVFPALQIQYCRTCARAYFSRIGPLRATQDADAEDTNVHPLVCPITRRPVDCYVELRMVWSKTHNKSRVTLAPYRYVPPAFATESVCLIDDTITDTDTAAADDDDTSARRKRTRLHHNDVPVPPATKARRTAE